MAAAIALAPKSIPIFLVGSCGSDLAAMNLVISKQIPMMIESAPSVADGFKNLITRERGILIIEINDKVALSQFAKIFQSTVKSLKLADIKIVIISTQEEIIVNRNLIQFTFIRTMKPILDMKKMSALLIRDYRELENRSQVRNTKSGGRSEIIIIRGGAQAKGKEEALAAAPEKKENPLLSCVGAKVPSFLYDKTCSWRVRGHFSSFDAKTSSIVFKTDDPEGKALLDQSLKTSPYIISSTSSVHARVCMTLDFLGQLEHQFVFKAPTMVQEIQRRNDQRLRVSEDSPVLCQFFSPTLNSDIALHILDLSSGGIGARMDKDLIQNYRPEQMVGDILLIFSQRVIKIKAAEVRHCSRSDTNPDFKILGLQFLEIDPKDKAFIDMYIDSRSV